MSHLNYNNSTQNNSKSFTNNLSNRVTELESRIDITENYYGEVFFTNGQGNSFQQILYNSNSMFDNLVSGNEFTYSGYYDGSHTYYGGTIQTRYDANGKYPTDIPKPGASATLITDQYSDGYGMHCDVFLIKKEDNGNWSYWPIEYNTIRNYM